jgi:hypothetical protein
MSRILKRPMFRIGGSANDGIMSNVVPKRAEYQQPEGPVSTEDNYQLDANDLIYRDAMRRSSMLSRFAGEGRSEKNRLLDLLLEGSLNLAGGAGAGAGKNIGQALALSFKEPAKSYAKGKQSEEDFQRQIRLAGVTGAMSAADTLAATRAKGKEQFAATLRPERLKTLLGTLEKQVGADPKQAIGLANKLLDFEDFAPASMKRRFKFVAPITTETFKEKGKSVTKTGVPQAFIESLDIGDTFLDSSSFDFKIKTTEGIKRLNPDTFELIGK